METSSDGPVTADAVAAVWRRQAPHVLGALVRRYGDFAGCEDAVAEAMIAAADHREWANLTALITAIGFAWPYAAIAFLGARLSSRRDGRRL